MKKCQSCSFVNADEMRFCVECGTPLSAAPMVINLQDSGTQKQSTADTASFDKSMETKIGGQPNFTPNFPTVAPSRGRSKSKILLVVGGLFALFMLLLTAGAAIVYFNWKPNKPVIIPVNTPTPAPTRTVEKPTPTPTPTPKPSPSPSVAPTPNSTSEPSGSFDKMSVDFNVTENNRFGMRIHVNFSAYNLKGVDSDLTIRFQKEDGSFLETDSGGYKNKNGEIVVKRELKPAYDNAVYEDLQLFMPYDALNLPRGKYNLKMDVDLTYENGDIIQHLNFYDFKYEEK